MFFDEGYISQHVALVRLLIKQIAYWIHFCIISDSIVKSQFPKMIYGDKPWLNLVQLNSLIIPIPTLSEQNRIVQKLVSVL
jgi:type I restriction enzyme S subunit